MHPLVSILIPAYNSEKWITATINSALNQTWSNKEIIIIDDGSTDNTFAIAKCFESKTLKVLSQKNKGASSARNYALSVAQGDYIQWLDSDDLLATDKIERQLSYSDCKGDSLELFSSSFANCFYRTSKAKFIPNSLWRDLDPIEWTRNYLIEKTAYMIPHTWIVSRKLTELAGPWDERLSYNDDGEYFFRVVAASRYVKFIREAKCYYRNVNSFSLSRGKSYKAFNSSVLATSLIAETALNLDNSHDTRQAVLKYFVDFISDIPPNKVNIAYPILKKIIELGGEIPNYNPSLKYKVIRFFLGYSKTTALKNFIWDLELLVKKNIDRFYYFLFKDGI